jgi:hypothetical protein
MTEIKQLDLEGSGIRYAVTEMKRGNTVPLFTLVWNLCSLSNEEKNDFQRGLLEYRDTKVMRRAEKLLTAYRHGSLVAGGVKAEAATAQVKEEFGRERSHIKAAVAAHTNRGGVFAVMSKKSKKFGYVI